MKLLLQNLMTQNYRQVGVEGVNLVYSLAGYLSGQTSASQEWHTISEKIPIRLKDRFLPELSNSFEYFQLLGFAPEAIHQNIVASGKTQSEIEKLEKLAGQINFELKNQDNE